MLARWAKTIEQGEQARHHDQQQRPLEQARHGDAAQAQVPQQIGRGDNRSERDDCENDRPDGEGQRHEIEFDEVALLMLLVGDVEAANEGLHSCIGAGDGK